MPRIVFASDNILVNPDFESWDGIDLVGWQKSAQASFSANLVTDSSLVKSGTQAAVLELDNVSLNSYRYLYQEVPIKSGETYRFSGWFKGIEGKFKALLRLAWCCKNGNSQIFTVDSQSTSSVSGDFSLVSLEALAPSDATSVKTRIVINPEEQLSKISLGIDNFSLVWLPPSQSGSTSQSTTTSEQNNTIGDTPTVSNNNPQIAAVFPKNVNQDKPFTVKVPLSNFEKNTQFYLKIRGGLTQNSLSKAQTKNMEIWLRDNESWIKFPLVTTSQEGSWQGEIVGKISSDNDVGNYFFKVRVRRTDNDSFWESAISEIAVGEPVFSVDSVQKSSQEENTKTSLTLSKVLSATTQFIASGSPVSKNNESKQGSGSGAFTNSISKSFGKKNETVDWLTKYAPWVFIFGGLALTAYNSQVWKLIRDHWRKPKERQK